MVESTVDVYALITMGLSFTGKKKGASNGSLPRDLRRRYRRTPTALRGAALLRNGSFSAVVVGESVLLVEVPGDTGADGNHDPFDEVVASILSANPHISLVPVGSPGDSDEESPGSLRYRLEIPSSIVSRLSDGKIFAEFLVGRFCQTAPGIEPLVSRQRPVEAEEVSAEEVAGKLESEAIWVCRMEGCDGPSREDTRLPVWFVKEQRENEENGKPGKKVAVELYRLQQAMRNLGFDSCRITVAQRRIHTFDVAPRYETIRTSHSEAFWPSRSVTVLRRLLASEGRSAEQRIFAFEAVNRGLLAIAYRMPRSAEERKSGYAVRTLYALLQLGGRGLREFVDSVYRSAEQFHAFVLVYNALGEAERRQLDHILGERRRAQLVSDRPDAYRRSGRRTVVEPWIAAADATELLVGRYVATARKRGHAVDVESRKIIDSYYLKPRSEALRSVWERARRDPEMERLIEEGRLSRLRALGRRVPRSVLVDAAVGTREEMKRKLSAVFSRRGRQMFLEDVDVIEGAIHRNEWIEWERLLSAQSQLKVLARKIQ